jgi:hypothetical protein
MTMAGQAVAAPNAVEHRIETLPLLEHPQAHLDVFVDRLNELGKDGWRVASVDLTFHPSYSPAAQPTGPIPIMLSRPRTDPVPIEYRIEQLPFQDHPERHLSEILARVHELEDQGWWVASVDLTHHPSYSPAAQPNVPLPVLFARER